MPDVPVLTSVGNAYGDSVAHGLEGLLLYLLARKPV